MPATTANETKTYDSILAAKYLMALACQKGQCLNATKVQKLLYIVYGVSLAKLDGHRIVSESPQAWPFGPVFARTQRRVNYDEIYEVSNPEFDEIRNDEVITTAFNEVIDKYSGFSAGKLSAWSHTAGSPWERTTKMPDFKWSMPIPDEFIRDYFSNISI